MLKAFKEHISANLSFLSESKVLVACSGGLDSVVLARLCKELGLEFGIAHCNFKLRGEESDGDEAFVKNLAGQWSVPYYIEHYNTEEYADKNNISIQVAARNIRYSWFIVLSDQYEYDYVLTAHHADDNLETFLINLSRGTGIDGLTGIPEVNDIFIRPLLPFSRDRILEYANQNNVKWREDSSNKTTKYLRNNFRHTVVPELKSVNPQFLKNFQTTLEYLKESKSFIKSQVAILKNELFEFSESDTVKISIHKLQKFGNPKAYVYFLLKDYGFTAWEDIVQILSAQPGKQIFSVTHRLVKDREFLLLNPIENKVTDRSYKIPEEENMIMIPSGTLKFRLVDEIGNIDLKTIYVDKEKLKYPLVVRKWKEGDYFYPLGMKGKKKLSKYFKDEKLSLLAKERVLLLCSGDEIVWIINYRADNRFKITPQTKQILKIKIT
ncbi:tRNA lysidine(34) synthetase TilS [Aquimarina sp. MMG016]|nr:tRNA lysidine(34) synthetase TilS [Aquimarina sp. MMG016]